MIQLRIGSETILSHFFWDAKLRFLFRFSKSREELSGICGLRKIRTIDQPGPRPSVVTIRQFWGMSRWYFLMIWWKWATLVSCVSFLKLDGSDLEGLVSAETKIFLEVGLVMPGSRSQLRGVVNQVWVWRHGVSDLEILSCWQLATLITCVRFWRHEVSDLEMMLPKIFWEVTLERERPDTSTAWGCIWSLKIWSIVWFYSWTLLRCERISLKFEHNLLCNYSINLVIFLRQSRASSGEEILQGSSGTDILEIRKFVHVLLWKWDIVNEGCRGK